MEEITVSNVVFDSRVLAYLRNLAQLSFSCHEKSNNVFSPITTLIQNRHRAVHVHRFTLT